MPGKNIRPSGKTLNSLDNRAGKGIKLINRVIVSTDNEEIAEISKKYNAEVPFITKELLMIYLANGKFGSMHWSCEDFYNEKFDLYVDLDCTSPVRDVDDIYKAIEQYRSDADAIFLYAKRGRILILIWWNITIK